ncbi:class II histone deacetylase [Ascidiaceihabitans sp.]|uniref:class II histone deacetylase n=1 Tax=Ascidiaceihabitans sp. TaxID=1872644 RepID=UPI003298C256
MATGFFWDEKTFWHTGGNYAMTQPVGGLVQPLSAGGLPESPETKRRLKNLMDVTGLTTDLDVRTAPMATSDDLLRVHPASYLDAFKALSDAGGGELGQRTPFATGGYEIAALSAGLSVAAIDAVLTGALDNAYALSRPPGHHCLPDFPNGFCLLNNIAIAIEAAQSKGMASKVAVLDWDVHHGNGTEAIYYNRDDILTISIHQENNYPIDSGAVTDRGAGAGEGFNINIPIPAGTGHEGYLRAFDSIVRPAITDFAPDIIIVACGFDASVLDPLSQTLATAETFRELTLRTKILAENICGGKLVLVHEGGYSEVYVPFCGHATLEALSDSTVSAPDPYEASFRKRQPNPRFEAFIASEIDQMARDFGF